MKTRTEKTRIEPFETESILHVLDTFADRVATKVLERLPPPAPPRDGPLLLTVAQAAMKLGRTVPAVEHLIREHRLPVVRIDRRVMLDMRDICALIEQYKKAV